MNLFENHINRKNHVANAYNEDIFAKVLNDKVSESYRDEVKLEFKGLTGSRKHNTELGMLIQGQACGQGYALCEHYIQFCCVTNIPLAMLQQNMNRYH